MNKIKNIFRLTLALGVFLAALSGYLAFDTYQFQSQAVYTEGTVTDLRFSRGDGSSSGVWYPQVTFKDNSGQTTVFESSVGSSSYRNTLGDDIGILYISGDPGTARIAGGGSLYLTTIISGFMAMVVLLIGGIGLRISGRGRRYSQLMHDGRPVDADIVNVELNEAIQINGRSPWRIVCQWLDPSNNTVHVFNSENFSYDPSPYIKEGKIKVYLSHKSSKKYYVDTSSFPKKC